jgi:hypothetical protein
MIGLQQEESAMKLSLVVFALVAANALPAFADDHLANAANANGAAERGFANPAGGNPSGVSGPASQPGSVPGLGDPNSGVDQGTPSFDPASRDERVDARSNR